MYSAPRVLMCTHTRLRTARVHAYVRVRTNGVGEDVRLGVCVRSTTGT